MPLAIWLSYQWHGSGAQMSLQMCEKSSINYIQLMFIDVNSIEAAQFDRFKFTISDRKSNRVGLSFNVIGSPARKFEREKNNNNSEWHVPFEFGTTFQHIIIYSIRQSYSPFSFFFVPHFSCRVVDNRHRLKSLLVFLTICSVFVVSAQFGMFAAIAKE